MTPPTIDLVRVRGTHREVGLQMGEAGRARIRHTIETAWDDLPAGRMKADQLALAEELDARKNVATGGTLFGNPLSAAASVAALTEVLTPEAYEHTTSLGGRLADGIAGAIANAGLPWIGYRFGPRAGQWYGPRPRTGADARALTDDELTRLLRIWMANRGIWEALPGAGPTVPVPATADDVDRYLEAYVDLLVALTS